MGGRGKEGGVGEGLEKSFVLRSHRWYKGEIQGEPGSSVRISLRSNIRIMKWMYRV